MTDANVKDMILQDRNGLVQIKRKLEQYFPQGTKITAHQVKEDYPDHMGVDRPIEFTYTQFLTPDSVEYVLWNQKEYEPRWDSAHYDKKGKKTNIQTNLMLAAKVERKNEVFLGESGTTVASLIIRKYDVGHVLSGHYFSPEFFASNYILEFKDALRLIYAARDYSSLMKDKNLEGKISELKSTRESVDNLEKWIYGFIEKSKYNRMKERKNGK